eukprot:TRINITY_DN3386_c0_g3_i13.p1 TRINITY_DN3386_c0_g3~~TRINITY_DN3386_c0_g3_i13.p1  ORF type:complete len:169 (-),score=27.01 TRINITY_DN3386_c0_g3_i13:35-541(-)
MEVIDNRLARLEDKLEEILYVMMKNEEETDKRIDYLNRSATSLFANFETLKTEVSEYSTKKEYKTASKSSSHQASHSEAIRDKAENTRSPPNSDKIIQKPSFSAEKIEEKNVYQSQTSSDQRRRMIDEEIERRIRDDNDRINHNTSTCLLYTSPSPRDRQKSRMPSSA